MTTALAVYEKRGEIAALREPDTLELMRTAIADMGVGPFQLDRMKIPGGGAIVFEVPTFGGTEAAKSLDIIIALAKGNEKAWYAESYSETGGGAPPNCSSHDGINGFGIRILNPGDAAEPEAHLCGVSGQVGCCPWNEWGSKRRDDSKPSKGKDCADLTYLYFFYGESRLPVLMVVPPTSVKIVREYGLSMAKFGRPSHSVVTRMSLRKVSGSPDYAELVLKPAGKVPEEDLDTMKALAEATREAFKAFDPTATPGPASDN